jgi:hypothetical protein
MKNVAAPKDVTEVVVPGVGHAPLLSEPESEKALFEYAMLVDSQ